MCFTITLSQDIKKSFDRFKATLVDPIDIDPLFYVNGFSFPKHPVILDEDRSHIQMVKWGLVPNWVKDLNTADKLQSHTLNARAETIYDKPSFKQSASKKHCLVLVDGFFEWRQFKGKKYPYHIHLKSKEPFALAGLWDEWIEEESGEIHKTFSIITCEANELLAFIHNTKKRMPVILTKENEEKWLESYDKTKTENLLIPYAKNDLEAHTVSKLITARGVNRNVPEVMKNFDYPELE